MPIELRASALGYGPCRGRWWAIHRRREVEDAGYKLAPRRQHIAGPLGSGVHAGQAYLLGELARTGELGGTERLQQAQSAAVDCFTERAGTISDAELICDKTTPSKRDAVLTINRMVELGAGAIDPAAEPVLVEQQLKAELASGVFLTATPDAYLLLTPGGGRVADLKTGRFSPVVAAEQLGAQSLLVRARYGTAVIAWLGVESQPRAPWRNVRPPVPMAMEQGICERMALAATEQIRRDTEVWEQRYDTEDIQKMPVDFLCSERFCPAFGVRESNAWCAAWRLKGAWV